MEYPVYCINLKERVDRKKNVEKEFEKIDIKPSNVIFLDFYKHKMGGRYGCYDSHMKVWKDFYINHADKEICIIFEDDVEVTENSKLYLKRAVSFIEKNIDNVDILFLHNKCIGYTKKNINKKSIHDKYFINDYGFYAHAYIVTRKYIQMILNKNNNHLPKPNGIHFDVDININQKGILYSENIYFCKNPIFIQKNKDESNNDNNMFGVDVMLRKKYGNDIFRNISMKLKKNLKLILLNDDDKTKKVYMMLTKMYFNLK